MRRLLGVSQGASSSSSADFDEPYPHGVEDQSVAELAAGLMLRMASIAALMSSSRRCS
jgi:hypothetical protein